MAARIEQNEWVAVAPSQHRGDPARSGELLLRGPMLGETLVPPACEAVGLTKQDSVVDRRLSQQDVAQHRALPPQDSVLDRRRCPSSQLPSACSGRRCPRNMAALAPPLKACLG